MKGSAAAPHSQRSLRLQRITNMSSRDTGQEAENASSIMDNETQQGLQELGLSDHDLAGPAPSTGSLSIYQWTTMAGLGAFCVMNVAVLATLPVVLRGKGAPYLPTFRKSMNAIFEGLKKDPAFRQRQQNGDPLTFVDLGSGDGRVVFRAAREQLFQRCIGYEINPFLHVWASVVRLVRPKYWPTTSFALHDLWQVNLRHVDVVAVYGLGPMMKDLGVKLRHELRPGSFVVSNVFTIPGWKAASSSNGTYVYVTPCWAQGKASIG